MAQREVRLSEAEVDYIIALRHQGLNVGPRPGRLLYLLRDGKVHGWEQIIAAIWGDDPDGGPLNPRNNVFVQLTHLKKKGLQFETVWAVGLRWTNPVAVEQPERME